MKLPIRPAPSPKGTRGTTKSATRRNDFPRRRANKAIAAMTPRMPPCEAMPPFQIAKISSGLAR
jgi:hypothetical protein